MKIATINFSPIVTLEVVTASEGQIQCSYSVSKPVTMVTNIIIISTMVHCYVCGMLVRKQWTLAEKYVQKISIW